MIVLIEKRHHGSIKDMYIAIRRLFGALTFIMEYAKWEIPIGIACSFQSEGQIYVLSIHEIILIQQSYFLQSRPPYHHERPTDNIYFTRNFPRKKALIITVEKDRKSTRLNSSHANISYAVFCLKKKTTWSRSEEY